MTNRFYLEARFDSRKSFYRKAEVEVNLLKGIKTLYSYNTKIMSIDMNGNITKYYDGWTQTTGRHIVEFCKQFSPIKLDMNKKKWDSLKSA